MRKLNEIGVFSVLLLFAVFFSNCTDPRNSGKITSAYVVEDIEMPKGLSSEVGGLGFLPSGRLIACFHRGEVMIYDLETEEWSLFAYGLHDPLGLHVISESEVLVMQQPELTRLKDIDGDGMADQYENVTDDFGISGNYHEFNYGPVEDGDGNLFFALNTASSGGGFRDVVRGTLNLNGRDGDGRRQMYSVVPYRGWLMKLTPDGTVIPYASGLRSPNGLGFDMDGNLFISENQGDWVPTSALYHMQEGDFYGHPGSLVWKEEWSGRRPFNAPIEELDQMRTRGAVLFPQGIIANSPSEPKVDDTGGSFGPFAGQLFVGEMNRERIVRVMMEKVQDQFQGACIPFIDDHGLRKGNNRLAFAPDGSLWVGQTEHGWAGAKGIQRISFSGQAPVDILNMSLTKDGFEITFTQEMNVSSVLDTANFKLRHYYYDYYKKDLEEPVDKAIQFDVQTVQVTGLESADDGQFLSLKVDVLKQGYIYELKLENIRSVSGAPLENNLICYTLNQLRQ